MIGVANGRTVSITGLGVPRAGPRAVTNDELVDASSTPSDEWIMERTGIRERRIAADDEALTDIALPGRARSARAGRAWTASDIDLLVVATVTPDMMFPATAALARRRARLRATPLLTTSRRLHRLHVRDRAGVRHGRVRPLAARARRRRRRPLEDPRLDRPLDARALRRRRRARSCSSASSRAASSASSSAPTAAAGKHLWLPGSGSRHVRRPGRVREDERPRGFQVRDACHGPLRREDPRGVRAHGRRRRRLRAAPGQRAHHRPRNEEARHSRRRRSSSTSTATGTPPPARSRSRSRMPRTDGMLKPGELVLMTGMGAGLTWGSALIEWTDDVRQAAMTQGRIHVSRPGLPRGGNGPRDRRGGARGDGRSSARAARRPGST